MEEKLKLQLKKDIADAEKLLKVYRAEIQKASTAGLSTADLEARRKTLEERIRQLKAVYGT